MSAHTPPEAPPACFGLQLNWMMEDCVFDPEEALKCYACPAFDRCHRLSLIRSLQQMKYEIRKSARGLRESLGGGHSQPLW